MERLEGPRLFSKGIKAGFARMLARLDMNCQMRKLGKTVRRTDAPEIRVPPQIELLSQFIPFNISAIENPRDLDMSKLPAAFLKDPWKLGTRIAGLRSLCQDDDSWFLEQIPFKTEGGIRVMSFISGSIILNDYNNIELFADGRWWRLNADHPVKEVEMEMNCWYGLDFTVISWMTGALSKYPKNYVIITDPESKKRVVFFNPRSLKLIEPFYGGGQWFEMCSWGLEKGAKLRFEIKGPYAEEEIEELKGVFKRPHEL
jgi:hypothetical protein